MSMFTIFPERSYRNSRTSIEDLLNISMNRIQRGYPQSYQMKRDRELRRKKRMKLRKKRGWR